MTDRIFKNYYHDHIPSRTFCCGDDDSPTDVYPVRIASARAR